VIAVEQTGSKGVRRCNANLQYIWPYIGEMARYPANLHYIWPIHESPSEYNVFLHYIKIADRDAR